MNPRYGKVDPYWMAASAIDEALRNNIAVGGRRVALLDNFVWGTPEKPDRLGGLLRACKACYRFSKGFGAPFISGKDSLYNESPLGPVTPTLLITAVGVIPDIRRTVTMDLKTSGNLLYLLGKTYPELGGSEYYRLMGFIGRSVPKVQLEDARKTMNKLTEAIDSGCVESCHDLSEGGLGVAAAEMAFSGDIGVEIWLDKVARSPGLQRNDYILFSESNSRFLVEVSEANKGRFEEIMEDSIYSMIGRTVEGNRFVVYGLDGKEIINLGLKEMMHVWKKTLGG